MKRKGLWGAVGVLILAGIIGCMCIGILKVHEEEKVEGYLVFNYDEVGPYGSLYYMTFTGEKTLITSHVLDEDSEYFRLDEDRNLVFYRDESGALYMMKIGEEPEQIGRAHV